MFLEKNQGPQTQFYGYADPDTCVIIGCVFGILKGDLKVIILLSVCRLTIPAEQFGAQVRYFLIFFYTRDCSINLAFYDQCCGSEYGLGPYSMGSQDPDSDRNPDPGGQK
jgi:hypothetical protein